MNIKTIENTKKPQQRKRSWSQLCCAVDDFFPAAQNLQSTETYSDTSVLLLLLLLLR